MRCKQCAFDNPQNMKFCGQCGQALICECPACQFENPASFRFCGNCSASLGVTEKPPAANPPPEPAPPQQTLPRLHKEAERRQLTVLFCDLVGSTALSEDVDPEDLRDIMREYRESCDSVVQRFNGHIAQYLGDGVLTYFGFPKAHEDDARRAAQSGLALVDKMAELNKRLIKEKGITLDIRVGIHTGLVVVGDLGGTDKRSLALGVTPNIAARLQDLAKPNTVIISAETCRLIKDDFDFVALGIHQPKGLSRPFEVFQVVCERDQYSRASKRRNSNKVPLIGREQEASLLMDRLDQARGGAGQVALLSGEAGIGKSRLAQFLSEQVTGEPHYLLQCAGSPYYQNSYLHCAVGILKRVLDITDEIGIEERIKYLEKPLAAFGLPLSESVPLLADLLGLSLPGDRYPALQLGPQQQKQKTLESLLGLVMAMSSHKLVFIVVEDLQWIDPTTLELIGLLIDQIPTSRVFALLTYRMGFTPPWAAKAHVSHITINRLTRKQTGRMIRAVANDKELPLNVFNEIVHKTDGTPFFIEELTRMVLESNLLRETGDLYELKAPLSSLAIPSTLQDSLMARLDRLGPEKELAQLSATLGREFGYALLKAVAARGSDKFEAGLSSLVSADLLYQHGLPPQASYTFRHALVHEVAYQSLLKKTRQQYHLHIASIITDHFPKMQDKNPEILAHHCTEAGDNISAIRHWLVAGQKAIQRSALQDAITQLNKGLVLIATLDDEERAMALELAYQPILGLAYMMCEGYGSSNVERSFTRAYTLCKRAGETQQIVPVLSGLWEYYVVRSELDTALELATMLITIARRSEDNALFLQAQRAMGSTHFWQGNLTEAWKHLERGFDINLPTVHNSTHIGHNSQNTEVANLSNASCVLWFMGFPEQSQDKFLQAITIAEQLKHPFSLVYACVFSAISYQLCGDVSATRQQANRILEISTQYDFGFWRPMGTMFNIWASLQENPDPQLLIPFEQALADYRNTGSRLAHAYFHAMLAELHLLIDQYDSVLVTLDDTIEKMELQNMRFFDAELYRLKGEVIARQEPDNTPAIEAEFRQAISIAQQQNARSLELRGCISLGRLWQKLGRHKEAITLLDDCMNYFTEGFESRDWQTATALSDELKAASAAGAPALQ